MKEEITGQKIKKHLKKSSHDFCRVGVGTSAGRLEAFTTFVSATPEDLVYMLVQHQDPNQDQLPEILQRLVQISVQTSVKTAKKA